MNRKAINRGFPLRLTYCFLTFLLLNLITGCAYYFKVETKTRLTPEDIRWEDFNKKYFILHSGESAMHLSAPEIKENRISGNLSVLPKTRSGKLLRRAIQAVCEGRDPGDLTTMEDPAALQQIRDLVAI